MSQTSPTIPQLTVYVIILFSDPNLPNEFAWKNHQPREHWYLDFNYTFWQSLSLSSPDMIKRDYRFHEVVWFYNKDKFFPTHCS